jgi:hypothetical protein
MSEEAMKRMSDALPDVVIVENEKTGDLEFANEAFDLLKKNEQTLLEAQIQID